MKEFNKTEMSILNGLKGALSFAKNEKDEVNTDKIEIKDIEVKILNEELALSQYEKA